MSKPCVFISCGQYTEAEKKLGQDIADLVKKMTGQDAFFAEQVHDFNGLHENILQAIQRCIGFIAVMHPRGTLGRPDKPALTRASVWIEQEIAIAAYIQFAENKTLPTAVFIHHSVGREGIRELLHLNPTIFADESEVLARLPALLHSWGTLSRGSIGLELESRSTRLQEGHYQFQLGLFVVNDTHRRIDKYDALLRFPARLLRHWSAVYSSEVTGGTDTSIREFRYSQNGREPILPRSGRNRVTVMDYCLTCGQEDAKAKTGFIECLDDDIVEATLWLDEQEYSITKTLGELQREGARP